MILSSVMTNRKLAAGIILCTAAALTACGSSDDNSNDGGETRSEKATNVAAQPYNVGGFLGGNADPNLPEGEQGEVSVVQIGPLNKDSGTLLFAFRNNTNEEIAHIDWSATARSGGEVVGSGSSQGTSPVQVQPGEVGFSYIYFDNGEALPDDTEYEFSSDSAPAGPSFYNTAPFTVTEANLVGDAIVGSATNETGNKVSGPYSVRIYCFEGDDLVSDIKTYASPDGDLDDGGTTSFSANVYSTPCETYSVGVSGYFPGD